MNEIFKFPTSAGPMTLTTFDDGSQSVKFDNPMAKITNAATARASSSNALESLAQQIEQSELSVEQNAKRSRVEPEQIEEFLSGDETALDEAEQARVADVVAIVKQIAATASTARRQHTAARAARKGTAAR